MKNVYANIGKIKFDGMQYRRDIAQRVYSTDYRG
jgi:phosphoribosylamine-glycine ligase